MIWSITRTREKVAINFNRRDVRGEGRERSRRHGERRVFGNYCAKYSFEYGASLFQISK